MASINPAIAATTPETTLRKRITRPAVFSAFFLIIGVVLLISNFSTPSDLTTTFTFGRALPDTRLHIPTGLYTWIVSIFYVIVGVVGVLPAVTKAGITALARAQSMLLLIAGILIIPTVLVLAAAGGSTNVTVMLQVSLRLATPVVLGALAGIWCERSGVVNVGIEGMMLSGACFGFVAFTLSLNAGADSGTGQFVGVLVAVLAGGAMALLHAWLSVNFKINQIVSGTVINILALGLTSYVRREVLLSSEAGRETLPVTNIPLLSEIPILGEVFFQGKPIFYSMFILLIITHVILFFTRWGLRTRAVGENPKAADTLGVNVQRIRWINVIISGLIAGLGGAWFSLETTGGFDDAMTSGRGFIALAAMIFGKWMPFGAFGGGLLFGFSDALGQRFQLLGVPIPPQFLQMVPYVITIVVLAGLVGRAVAPKADGVPYEKEGK